MPSPIFSKSQVVLAIVYVLLSLYTCPVDVGVVGEFVDDRCQTFQNMTKSVVFTGTADLVSVSETWRITTRGWHVANKHVDRMCYLVFCDKPLVSVTVRPDLSQ